MVEIDIDVIGNIQIKVAIVVVVAEGRAGSPAAGIAHASLRCDIGKRAVVIVAVENSAIEIGNVKIFPAVVVVVADGYAESPAAMCDSGFRRHVMERAIVIIAVKLAGMAFAGVNIFDGRSVDEVNIHPAIVVVIENGNPAAHRVHDVALVDCSAGQMEVDTRRSSHVGKRNSFGRRSWVGGLRLSGQHLRESQQKEEEGDPEAAHHWIRPVAMPPVCGCAFFNSAKRCRSNFASSALPVFSSARAN